jgi:hypothetical protein
MKFVACSYLQIVLVYPISNVGNEMMAMQSIKTQKIYVQEKVQYGL